MRPGPWQCRPLFGPSLPKPPRGLRLSDFDRLLRRRDSARDPVVARESAALALRVGEYDWQRRLPSRAAGSAPGAGAWHGYRRMRARSAARRIATCLFMQTPLTALSPAGPLEGHSAVRRIRAPAATLMGPSERFLHRARSTSHTSSGPILSEPGSRSRLRSAVATTRFSEPPELVVRVRAHNRRISSIAALCNRWPRRRSDGNHSRPDISRTAASMPPPANSTGSTYKRAHAMQSLRTPMRGGACVPIRP